MLKTKTLKSLVLTEVKTILSILLNRCPHCWRKLQTSTRVLDSGEGPVECVVLQCECGRFAQVCLREGRVV